jgi:hypothetical protein
VIDGLAHRGRAIVEVGCTSSPKIRWLHHGVLWRVGLSVAGLPVSGLCVCGLCVGGLCVGGLVGHLHDDGGSIIGVVGVLPHDFLPQAVLLSLAVAVAYECDEDDHTHYTSDDCSGDHTWLGLIVVVVTVTRGTHTGTPEPAAVEGAVLVETL